MVEREADLVLNRRMESQGMRCKRANADGVAALRTREYNAAPDGATDDPQLAA
jgi:hypothetical protein